jgi:hypothetical protein
MRLPIKSEQLKKKEISIPLETSSDRALQQAAFQCSLPHRSLARLLPLFCKSRDKRSDASREAFGGQAILRK